MGFKYLLITCWYNELVKGGALKRIKVWELARAFVIHWGFAAALRRLY